MIYNQYLHIYRLLSCCVFIVSSLTLACTAYALKLDKYRFSTSDLYAVSFNPTVYEMQIARALDGQLGREDVLSIAKRNSALAAINGSFWAEGGKVNGSPAFLLKVNHQLFLQKSNYPIAYFSKSGEVGFTAIDTAPKIRIGAQQTDCSINMPQTSAPVTVYTTAYARTTLSNPQTVELIVEDNTVTKVSSNGNSIIPENGFVIVANTPRAAKQLRSLKLGAKVALESTVPVHLQEADYIISGSNMLLQDGELADYLTDPNAKGAFHDLQHARSAICKMRDGNIGLISTDYVYENDLKTMTLKEIWEYFKSHGINREKVMSMTSREVMDQYQKLSNSHNLSKGLSMVNFALALKEYGCIEALNLDGGSSTTLIYKDKIIVGREPKLMEDTDAIIVRAKK